MGASRAFFVTLILLAVVFIALYHVVPQPVESTTPDAGSGAATNTSVGNASTSAGGNATASSGSSSPGNVIATNATTPG